jgi:uncharacterized protein YecE (DUF72 family)
MRGKEALGVIVPGIMSIIKIGTCGYSYTEWTGPVYPEGTQKEDFLALYAGMFPTVELDYAYYQMPTAEQLEGMAEKAAGLTFAIKAYQTLTHKVDASRWKEDAQTYRDSLVPLLEAGRLEAVLFQFPYSFHYEPEHRRL